MNKPKANLSQLTSLVVNKDSRAPFANVTNARHLMGDIEDGDLEEGDADFGDSDYGDADHGDAEYGDINSSPLAVFDTLIGDAEVGGPNTNRRIKQGVGIVGGVTGGALLGRALTRAYSRKVASRKNVNNRLQRAKRQQTIQNQMNARQEMGKLSRTAKLPFYQVMGATLNSAPLSATECFVADTLKFNLDRQATDTPFEVEVVSGTFAGITWTATATGLAAPRYYAAVVLVIGINQLAANPGTIFSVTGTLPTINGALVIASNPFSFTLRNGYYAKFLLFPWQLVTNKPLLALGAYSNANPITLSIVGLPSNATVNLTIPGSQHSWTIAMRNRLI